jgi:hypothetical protein
MSAIIGANLRATENDATESGAAENGATQTAATQSAAAQGAAPPAAGNGCYVHQQSAHCESGVVSALLRTHGQPLSEAMVFGLGSALSFAYLPIVKINGLPLISYRMPPRHILRKLQKLLRLPLRFETFRRPQQGEQRLNELLHAGKVVGAQTSVFFLPYFPVNMRFHFNAHNLLVYGREHDEYLISDPVFEHTTRSGLTELTRARFVRGVLAPKGLLYYFDGAVPQTDIPRLLLPAIRQTCRMMLQPILPFAGVKGIRLLAKRVERLNATREKRFVQRYVGHIVRMQEEIGTGGAGFRFLYAAFLQEAARLLGDARFDARAQELTTIGDKWRDFAYDAARMSKGRDALDVAALGRQLRDLADQESALFRGLQGELK